jgi:selenocysteine-specific elongation factor
LYLNRPVPLLPGDRFILRESGRDETVGGGQILDIEPILPASRAKPDRSIERLVGERGWVEADHLSRLTGETIAPTVGRWVVDPAQLEETKKTVLAAIGDADALGLDVASLDDRQRAVTDLLEEVQVAAGRATIGEVADPLADHHWVKALAAEPFAPPGADGVDRGELRELVRRGTVIEQDGVYFAKTSIDHAIAILGEALEDQPTGLTVAEIRDLLGTTRKFALPILAHLDGTGVTRRREDVRIAGPRMPAR